ncbi:aspartate aminotransferase family protein [Chitinimonas naiadis]
MSALPIGGFFPIEPPMPVTGSVLKRWVNAGQAHACFQNARSAIAAVLRAHGSKRLLLPAYICDSVIEAATAAACEVDYYPLAGDMSPDLIALRALLPRSGDAVLVVDYFGRPPSAEVRAELVALPALLLEDCAQALDPGVAPWADWRIYSPRKLLGVADGGILRRDRARDTLPVVADFAAIAPPLAPLLRFEDPAALAGERWYAQYQQEEAQQAVSSQPMSRWSHAILDSVELAGLSEARHRNYARYQAALAAHSLLGDARGYTPMGFVFRHVEADRIWRSLVGLRVFAPRHWRQLPSPEALFPKEHALAAQLITLPVDHRLNEHDVDRVIEHVVSLL